MAQKNYELILVLSDKNADEKTHARDEVESSLTKRGAEVSQKEDWGARRLFHLAKKQDRGHYFYYNFKAEPSAIQQITGDLRVNAGVIKSMITALNA
ncbi:MAG: 30S ribosomal protein S6 [Turneriella sp.]|nr:30S ribosomal protein S6 [Turneriella sp.]